MNKSLRIPNGQSKRTTREMAT